jgi:hypothetical protein
MATKQEIKFAFENCLFIYFLPFIYSKNRTVIVI